MIQGNGLINMAYVLQDTLNKIVNKINRDNKQALTF